MSLRLSPHLTLLEVMRTSQPHPNVPGPAELWELMVLARRCFEPFRSLVGPLRVTSGYRSPEVNAAVGGAQNSQHARGQAVDVAPLRMDARHAFEALERSAVPVDQAILYHPSRGGHIHVSHRADGKNRRQFLYAPAEGGYVAWPPEAA